MVYQIRSWGQRHKDTFSSDAGSTDYCTDVLTYLENTIPSHMQQPGEVAKMSDEERICRLLNVARIKLNIDGALHKITCADVLHFFTNASYCKKIANGGFNDIYENKFMPGVVIRVTRTDRKTENATLYKKRVALVKHLIRSDPELFPELHFTAMERGTNVVFEAWQKCDGNCQDLITDGFDVMTSAYSIVTALEKLANCGYLNVDIKLSNLVYENVCDTFTVKVIDIDPRFFVSESKFADVSSSEDTRTTFAAIMIATLSYHILRHRKGSPLGCLLKASCKGIAVSEDIIARLDKMRVVTNTYKKYSKKALNGVGDLFAFLRN